MTKPARDRMLAQARQILHPSSSTTEQQAFAIGWLCEELDAVLLRLAKLEALSPECRDVVGSTASGQTVHGLRTVDVSFSASDYARAASEAAASGALKRAQGNYEPEPEE